MSLYDDLKKEDLLDLLQAYDSYIITAFDAKLPETGWTPVCIEEFYQCEYQNVWLQDKNFDYMFHEDEPEITTPTNEIIADGGVRIFKENDLLFCQWPDREGKHPLRSRIQDIRDGDAFLTGSGLHADGFLVREAFADAHQNMDERDCPWIVYDTAGDSWFEEDILNAKRYFLSAQYGKAHVSDPELTPVVLVNLLRERHWENKSWYDSFWVNAKEVPTVDLFRAAVQSHLKTEAGLRDIEMTSEDFNWGDAVMFMPQEAWNKHGIYPFDYNKSPKEMGLEQVGNGAPVILMVDQDEVLIPESYFEEKWAEEHRSLSEMIDAAEGKVVQASHNKQERNEIDR